MNIQLTRNPDKATRIRQPDRPADITEIEDTLYCRTAPRFGDYDEGAYTFKAIVATNTPVQRRDQKGPFLEVLDPAGLIFDPTHDLPLLENHMQSARSICGAVRELKIDGPSVKATIHLSNADDLEPIRQRLKDGSLKSVSAGYRVHRWDESRDPAIGQRTKTATKWEILEVSLVAIPADPNATIQRSLTMPFDLNTRNQLIETLRSACGLASNWGEDLGEEAVTDDQVREAARDAMTQRAAPAIRVQTRSNDNPAEVQTRAADALAFRMGSGSLPDASREFVNMSLMEHARDAVQRAGHSVRGMSSDEVLQRALTTSDFPLVVSNAANKVVADGYRIAESPLKVLFRQRSLSDFKTSTAVRLGGMGMLAEMTESGEFTATSRGEEGETLQLRTFGRRLDLTRKLIINDDLGLFADTTRALGEAAAATEAQLMVDLLLGTDKLSDGQRLFHASRSNIVAPAGDVIEALTAGRLVLRKQTNLDGKTPIQATPKYVVCGPSMETKLEIALMTIQPTDTASVNPHAGKYQLLVDPRITDDTWFVFADPAQCAVFNQAVFSTAPGPQIQRQEAWDTLGVSFRCWMDTGVGFAGWRGAVKVGV